MSLSVATTPDADTQIREIYDWWRTNRRSSPDLFLEELTASFDIIGDAPHIGRLYRQSPVPGTRVLFGSYLGSGWPPDTHDADGISKAS